LAPVDPKMAPGYEEIIKDPIGSLCFCFWQMFIFANLITVCFCYIQIFPQLRRD
jgi:hypothetical protein